MISTLLRKLGLLRAADYARFWFFKLKNRKRNQVFRQQFSTVALPPDYLMYESFQLDYQKYYQGGRQTAQWIWEQVTPFLSPENSNLQILDWGCGPGRVVRHLPDIIGPSAKVMASDYNQQSIAWCQDQFPSITFKTNSLIPPLNFENETFHLIYAISIFTHLSQEMHYAWWQEMMRVLQPGGIFFFTTQGGNFIKKLTHAEEKQYHSGRVVVRGKVKEGHRTYSAFQPPQFIQQLVGANKVLQHQTPPILKGKALPQDVWIVQKA